MQIRKMKQKIERQIVEIFPTIPKIDITAYIHHHPSLSVVDFIVHFLEISEPTKKNLDVETQLLLAQARQILQHKNEEEKVENDDEILLTNNLTGELLEIQKRVNMFEIPNSCQKFSIQLFQLISKFRLQKKRSKFQDEDYLNRLAFTYSKELELGYINLDSDEWIKWSKSHPDFNSLSDINFLCGFIPQVTNPVQSIMNMIEGDPEMRKLISSSVRFCGIGIAFSRNFSVFFAIYLANRK